MNTHKYLLSFTAASLSINRSIKIADIYLQLHDWTAVKDQVVSKNLLQARTQKSITRIYHELALRLHSLTDDQLTLLVTGTPQEQRHVLWIAVCKQYAFIREFATEVIHEKYLGLSYNITPFDYDAFFNRKADWHDELDKITDSTRKKIREVLFRILREAELLSADNVIIPTLVSQQVQWAFSPDFPTIIDWFPASISNILE